MYNVSSTSCTLCKRWMKMSRKKDGMQWKEFPMEMMWFKQILIQWVKQMRENGAVLGVGGSEPNIVFCAMLCCALWCVCVCLLFRAYNFVWFLNRKHWKSHTAHSCNVHVNSIEWHGDVCQSHAPLTASFIPDNSSSIAQHCKHFN